MTTIFSLTYQPGRSEYQELYCFNRIATNEYKLIGGHGIEGDFKAGRNPRRQLNIMSRQTVMALAALGYGIASGELGEQMVIDGLDVATLPPGSHLQIGEDAVVELTMLRTGCEWLGLIHGHENAASETEGMLGMLAMVIQSGTVKVGDTVQIRQTIEQVSSES